MLKISSTLIAGLLGATLIAVPAMAREGQGGGGGGGGHVMRSGGGGGKAVGGGGGGVKSFSGNRFSGGNIARAPRNSGNFVNQSRSVQNRSVQSRSIQNRSVQSRTAIRDRNIGAERHRDGNRGHHRGTRYLWGGLPFYFYDGYYHGDCGWLRRRAELTGSRYWWIRYRQCREDD